MKATTKHAEIELLLTPTDTKMAKVLEEAEKLARSYPEILDRIEHDQKALGVGKKVVRIETQRWQEHKVPLLFTGEEWTKPSEPVQASDLELEIGRPRMPAKAVFLFLMIRGCYGSIVSQSSWDRVVDSMTLRCFLGRYMGHFPGRTTVVENLNTVSRATLEYILDCQLSSILGEGLDDFRKQTIDSTSVHGNSAWPTDIRLIRVMLENVLRWGQRLGRFGLPNFRLWHLRKWQKDLTSLEFQVNLSSEKRGRRFKRAYLRFIKRAVGIADVLVKERDHLDEHVSSTCLPPMRQRALQNVWQRIERDLSESYILLYFTADRVLGSGSSEREDHEKIFSVSDRSAAFIKKGQRETVFGYKVQLGRSDNGFVTSVLVPDGNAADSTQLYPMVYEHIKHTCVIPNLVSTDDGYTSKAGRDAVLGLGVHDVSLSGSKGKKITSSEDWESDLYTQARSDRSAVESLMFTGKHSFDFGRFRRRGIDAARCEMLEKVIAYNFWRMDYERHRQDDASVRNQRRRLRPQAA